MIMIKGHGMSTAGNLEGDMNCGLRFSLAWVTTYETTSSQGNVTYRHGGLGKDIHRKP